MADRVVIFLNSSGARSGVKLDEAILVGGMKRGSTQMLMNGSNGIDLIASGNIGLVAAIINETATTINKTAPNINEIATTISETATNINENATNINDNATNVNLTGSATVVITGGAVSLDGSSVTTVPRLTTTASATHAAARIGSVAGDPSSLADGDIWYNSTLGKFRKRESGVTSGFEASEAATFVVHPTAGVGDFTTIQAALNALPAEGGLILVREGTYLISAALAIPDKSVTIRGVNQQSVIISLGSNAIYAATFLHSAAAYRTVKLEGLTIQGDGTVNQKGFHLNDPNFNAELIWEDVAVFNVDIGVYDEGCAGIEFYNTAMLLADRDGVMHYDSTVDLESTLWIDNCTWENTNGAKKRGGIGGGAFVNIANSRLDCGTGTTLTRAQITGSRFAADGTFTGTKKVSMGNSRGCEMSACEFRGGAYLELATGPCTAVGNIFRDTPTRAIDVLVAIVSATISNNVFTWASEAVRNAGSGLIVSGNGNCKITETGASDNNKYTDILSTSTIIGPNTTVDGAKRFDVVGATTSGSFVTLFTHTNPKAVFGIGTVDNVGVSSGNALEVKETVTDAFGITASVTTTVAAGDTYLLDPQTNFNTARPPYVSYKVEIRHPVAATSYTVHHATEGAL